MSGRAGARLACAAVLLAVVSGCGLTSGSPMVDDVEPGTIGQGKPLGARNSP